MQALARAAAQQRSAYRGIEHQDSDKTVKRVMTTPADSYLWPHLVEVPAFRALIRSIEHRLLAEYKPFATPILDVGAGDGHFAQAALGPQLDVGIDVSMAELRAAQQRGVYRSLLCASATEQPFSAGSFATIISNCVIEHIPDLQATLSEMYRTLRPGGRLLLTVPTSYLEQNFLIPRLLRSVGMGPQASAYLDWFRNVQVHYHLLTPAAWQAALTSVGFVVDHTRSYMSARATRTFELLHYGGWHNLLAQRLTGRWVVWRWRPRFAPTEHVLRQFLEEAPHADDSCLFLVAHRP
jgi:SAM-dependent methyltransferase